MTGLLKKFPICLWTYCIELASRLTTKFAYLKNQLLIESRSLKNRFAIIHVLVTLCKMLLEAKWVKLFKNLGEMFNIYHFFVFFVFCFWVFKYGSVKGLYNITGRLFKSTWVFLAYLHHIYYSWFLLFNIKLSF